MSKTRQTKFMLAETKALDKNGRVHAVVSTETKDRDGDIIRAAGWDLTDFMKNPQMLSSHNYFSLQAVIGEWEDMAVKGKKLIGVGSYFIDDEFNLEARAGYNLAVKGRAVYSVGFDPDSSKMKHLDEDNPFGGWEYNGQSLLEVSQVSIPSNPDALQIMKALHLHPTLKELMDSLEETETDLSNAKAGVGVISQADLDDWMNDRMRKLLKEIMPNLLKGPPRQEPVIAKGSSRVQIAKVLEDMEW